MPYDYDRRFANSPLGEFDTPEKVDTFKQFTRALAWWMGMSSPAGIKNLLRVLKSAPWLQKWLVKHVNPASEQLYYGARWPDTQLPEAGSLFKRFRGILQWSRRVDTARWFAGLTDPNARSTPEWRGGVLCQGRASGREILIDVDAMSAFLGKHRQEFEAFSPDTDSLAILNGEAHEGEVLTTGAVKAHVMEARLF